jgi:mannan endo-1,4-beta-mannosidase
MNKLLLTIIPLDVVKERKRYCQLSFLTLLFLLFTSFCFAQELVTEVEAESGVLNGVQTSTATSGYSGTGYVTGFDNADDYLTVSVKVPSKAFYSIVITYRSASGFKTQYISINGSGNSPINFTQSDGFAQTNVGKYLFNQGENTISIRNYWGWVELDKFSILTAVPNVYDITTTLIDADADIATSNLYKYLRDNYRTKIISGHTEGHQGTIKDISGYSPKLHGFDFQHYTEGYPYLWKDGGFSFGAEDDGSTDRAIDFYKNKNGIVTFHWHWHSPSGGEVGKNTFSTWLTTFDVSKAVTPGTTEYDLIIRDIDAIAVQLKKLQDAGVPVLWRPLHEAGGGWFWWGAKGAEPAKKLWDILYDRLENHHQLNNLIWVWSTPETDWYPGNDKVDILGYDSYPGAFNYSSQKNMFDVMHTLSNGKKIVAMTENGPIPDVNECLTYDAPWAYFMTWNNSLSYDNSEAHIKDIYTNSKTITLEAKQTELNFIADGVYKITPKHSGKPLEVEKASLKDGGNVIQSTYSGADHERWNVKKLSDGYYSITNVKSGKALDVLGFSTSNGGDINQWTYNGTKNQKWKIETTTEGYYQIVSVNSSKCVDVAGISYKDGASIHQWTCLGSDNQSFSFELLSTSSARLAPSETKSVNSLAIYPNPSDSEFTIEQDGLFTYEIKDKVGKILARGSGNGKVAFGKELPTGVYIIKVDGTQTNKTVRIIKH